MRLDVCVAGNRPHLANDLMDEQVLYNWIFSLLPSSAVSEFTGQRKGFEFLACDPVSSSGYVPIMLAMVIFGSR